jgi:hypothetical protein
MASAMGLEKHQVVAMFARIVHEGVRNRNHCRECGMIRAGPRETQLIGSTPVNIIRHDHILLR